MTNILRKFPNDPVAPDIERGEGPYLYLKNGTKYLELHLDGHPMQI